MGFHLKGVWIMGYQGVMGYGVDFPTNQVGQLRFLWGMREYGSSEIWVKRESTVFGNPPKPHETLETLGVAPRIFRNPGFQLILHSKSLIDWCRCRVCGFSTGHLALHPTCHTDTPHAGVSLQPTLTTPPHLSHLQPTRLVSYALQQLHSQPTL
jgi:hypothetical protein